MPDVSIDNTPVNEDLAQDESVTVPTGESWDVTIAADPSDVGVDINSSRVTRTQNDAVSATISIVLHEGDTVTADLGDAARIRGWVVRS